MRRKDHGQSLVKNEERILLGALDLRVSDTLRFHGYLLNKHLAQTQSKALVMSTLYRALARLTERGLLTAEWELPTDSEQWRKVYELTGEGAQAAMALLDAANADDPSLGFRPGSI